MRIPTKQGHRDGNLAESRSASPTVPVLEHEVEFTAIRSQGPGGQHVNKASTAVQLRFNIAASGLSESVKLRLLAMADQRITRDGVVVIKAQGSRSQEANKAEALARLAELIEAASHVPRKRKATRPTFGAKQRRLQGKAIRSEIKANRGKVDP